MNTQETNSPLNLFQAWYDAAKQAQDPCLDMMSLATATSEGMPSVRIVLFKGLSEGGFEFFTNYGSRKARELDANANAALTFYWPTLQKQIRIEGAAGKLSRAESEKYFKSRPRGSQIGAWASRQSSALPHPGYLESQVAMFEKRFAGAEVPCPEFWGGYRLIPRAVEFWEGRENRLHDRTLFRSRGGVWASERLCP